MQSVGEEKNIIDSREKFINAIINHIIFDLNGSIFGGFVRRWVKGEPIYEKGDWDIDVLITIDKNSLASLSFFADTMCGLFIKRWKKYLDFFKISYPDNFEQYFEIRKEKITDTDVEHRYCGTKLIFSWGEFLIKIDFVREIYFPNLPQDYNVNRLCLRSTENGRAKWNQSKEKYGFLHPNRFFDEIYFPSRNEIPNINKIKNMIDTSNFWISNTDIYYIPGYNDSTQNTKQVINCIKNNKCTFVGIYQNPEREKKMNGWDITIPDLGPGTTKRCFYCESSFEGHSDYCKSCVFNRSYINRAASIKFIK